MTPFYFKNILWHLSLSPEMITCLTTNSRFAKYRIFNELKHCRFSQAVGIATGFTIEQNIRATVGVKEQIAVIFENLKTLYPVNYFPEERNSNRNWICFEILCTSWLCVQKFVNHPVHINIKNIK